MMMIGYYHLTQDVRQRSLLSICLRRWGRIIAI